MTKKNFRQEKKNLTKAMEEQNLRLMENPLNANALSWYNLLKARLVHLKSLKGKKN